MTATERPSELKACPFCGQSGNAKVWDGHDPITGMNRGVFCVCGASMRCGEDSATAWNARALDAAPADPAPTNSPEIGSKSVVEPTAEHWRRATSERFGNLAAKLVEQRARELAQEGK